MEAFTHVKPVKSIPLVSKYMCLQVNILIGDSNEAKIRVAEYSTILF